MSKVKLVVEALSLDDPEVKDVEFRLPEGKRVIGVIRTDFDVSDDGTKRSSDEMTPVVTWDHMNNLTGKLLTLVEATVADSEQRKAAKDLFRNTAWDWYHDIERPVGNAWREDKKSKVAKCPNGCKWPEACSDCY